MLLGRGRELEEISRRLDTCRPVVLVGAAGIGKSTLGRAALDVRGAWREGGALATLAWSPLLVFRRLLGVDPPEQPDEVASMVLRTDGAVLLDDLQWADDASLDVVSHLVGRVPLVATVRTGEPRTEHVLGALSLVGFHRMHLAGLGSRSSADLVARLHPTMPPDERARLLADAGGNPLLLRELPGGVSGSLTLVSALLGRLASISSEAQAAMERLAVLGRPADHDLIGAGADVLVRSGLAVEVDGSVSLVHALLGEAVVDNLGPLADDIRRALAREVPVAERAHLLEAAGDQVGARAAALEAAAAADQRSKAELLALAVRCAPPGDLDPQNRLTAARLFTKTSQPALARELCQPPGLDTLPAVERGALLGAAAEACWLQGRQEECFALLERALDDVRGTRTDIEVLVLAGSTLNHTWVGLDGRPALDRAREAVHLADEIGQEQGFARSRLASVLLTAGEPGWSELYEEVVVRAAAAGDDDLRSTALNGLVLGHWVAGDPREAERLAREEVARGPRQTPDATWLSFVSYVALLGLLSGRKRSELVEEFLPVLDREPVFRSRPFLEAALILALADLGRHVEAGERASGAVVRAGLEAQWRSVAYWAVAEAAWLGGRPADAVKAAAAVVGLGVGDYPAALYARVAGAYAARDLGLPVEGPVPTAPLPAWRAVPVEWAALRAASDGRHGEAVELFAEAADAWERHDVRSATRCAWAAGEAAVATGSDDAIDRLEHAERLAEGHGLVPMSARILRSLRATGAARRHPSVTGTAGLTSREEEVLDLVGAGLRSSEIAAALGIEPSTVESFVRSATRKLDAPTRLAAAARLAELRRG